MEFILALLETAVVSISFFLVKKYVLLEKDLPPKKQRIFLLDNSGCGNCGAFTFRKRNRR